MTDELTPEQEIAVRRLLAEARHEEPMPADVADRLDHVLDGLVADPDAGTVDDLGDLDDLEVLEPGTSGSVTDLAGVRRRRNAGRLLLAAAAIVIGGVVVGQALGDTSLEGDDDAGSASGTALQEAPREDEAGDTAAPQTGSDAATGSGAPEAESAPAGAPLLDQVEVPVELSSANFAADVQRQLRRTGAERSAAANSGYDGVATLAGTFDCADGPYGQGAKLPAYYDAEEAVLVLRRPRAGIQRVDLLTCGTAEPLNSVDLPAP